MELCDRPERYCAPSTSLLTRNHMSDEELNTAAKDEEGSSSSQEEGSSSEEEEMEIEYNVKSRSRRATAGNKMASLIASSIQEDEFYNTAYEGGFNENDEDQVYESPGHSDEDEVDSDFDQPEVEEEQKSGDEEDTEKRPRNKKAFKEPPRGNHKWAVARMGGPVVAANTVDAKTQKQRLKEAEETERINIESLKRYEATELDRKKKREKVFTVKKIAWPYESIKSTKEGNSITVPDIKEFEKPKREIPYICAVTSRPAKYKDPLTGLPYASPFAFKVIRDQYNKFLKTNKKNNPEVAEYLSQFVDS